MVGRAIVVVVVLSGCAELPPLEHGICGNGVVEVGEDCDGSVDATLACGAITDDHACRYTCRAASCPDGWGCGDDGACRHATGEIDVGAAVSAPHADLAIGEIDGVRGGELVAFGPAGVRVAFGDEAVLLGRPDALTRPGSVADLDGDGRDDIVAPIAMALAVWRGEHGQTPTPIAYAPFTAPEDAWFLPVRVPRAITPNPDVLAILQRSGTGTAVELLLGGMPNPKQSITTLVAPSAFGAIAIRADLDAPSAGEELVLVAAGQDRAWIVRPPASSSGEILVDSLLMPDGEVSDGRVAAGDIDGDGDIDLLFGTLQGNAFGLAAVINPGTLPLPRAAHAAVADLAAALAMARTLNQAPSGAQPFPLAVGDLNGDGRLDAVSPDAVLVSNGAGWDAAYRRATATPWREALITNVDRGAMDVVVADGPRLTVLRQGTLGFTTIPIDTAGSISHLRAGDFDGDGIGDVAFREHDASGDRARVQFGSDGLLDAPLLVTRAANIVRYEVGRFADADGVVDAADDLIAVVVDENATRAAFLPGAGDRRIGSPLILAVGATLYDRPLGVVAGRFQRDRAVGADLAVLADRRGEAQLWLFRSTAGAAYTLLDSGIARAVSLDRFTLRRALAADLRGDGTDELVMLGVAPSGTTHVVTVDFDVAGPPVVAMMPLDIGEPFDLAAGDADRDGRSELVAVGMRSVALLRGNQVEMVSIKATSACFAQLDADPARELVLLEQSLLHVVDLRDVTERYVIAAPPNGIVVRAADLDGDGVDDLVVGDGLVATRLLSRTQIPR